MKPLIFIDTETTGIDADDRLLQVAYMYRQGEELVEVNELFKPPVPIKIGAMATHHVTEEMVVDRPSFVGSFTHLDIQKHIENEAIFVAHNAQYDMNILKREGINVGKYICTLKVARALLTDPAIESYSLQYLRYFMKLKVDLRGLAPHDALADIIVLRELFGTMHAFIKKTMQIPSEQVIEHMLKITSEPSLIKKITFGKYAKQGITDIAEIARQDKDYLRWLLNEKLKAPEGEEDWIYSLRYYINGTGT